MYNGKEILFPVGYRKFHTIIKCDKNAPTNKYQSKNDQDSVFGSVASLFAAICHS